MFRSTPFRCAFAGHRRTWETLSGTARRFHSLLSSILPLQYVSYRSPLRKGWPTRTLAQSACMCCTHTRCALRAEGKTCLLEDLIRPSKLKLPMSSESGFPTCAPPIPRIKHDEASALHLSRASASLEQQEGREQCDIRRRLSPAHSDSDRALFHRSDISSGPSLQGWIQVSTTVTQRPARQSEHDMLHVSLMADKAPAICMPLSCPCMYEYSPHLPLFATPSRQVDQASSRTASEETPKAFAPRFAAFDGQEQHRCLPLRDCTCASSRPEDRRSGSRTILQLAVEYSPRRSYRGGSFRQLSTTCSTHSEPCRI